MDSLNTKYTIHVEVCIKPSSASFLCSFESLLKDCLKEYLIKENILIFNKSITLDESAEIFNKLLNHVESICQECYNSNVVANNTLLISPSELDYTFYIYGMNSRVMEVEMFETDVDNHNGFRNDECDVIPCCNHWLLPSKQFKTTWEHLYYEDNIKAKLLHFALSALKFSSHQVDTNIISCNRLILLHGPPGTGKTSLCKALAQKLAIRTRTIYTGHTHFIEINAHSLFSKWFSESGKLVFKMFAKIREIVMDPNKLACILIDEIESLAYERQSLLGGTEPKDSMRVVNALLTQLDALREYPNVITFATSNLVNAIDRAFIDRVDIKQCIDLPSKMAIENMYRMMFLELMNSGVLMNTFMDTPDVKNLYKSLSEISLGLSGRAIRKLPYRAYTLYCVSEDQSCQLNDNKMSFHEFYDNLVLAIKEMRKEIYTERTKE